jgi:hypothetical protein
MIVLFNLKKTFAYDKMIQTCNYLRKMGLMSRHASAKPAQQLVFVLTLKQKHSHYYEE